MAKRAKREAPEEVTEVMDIDDLLVNRPKNRVHRIGVELEGGWPKLPVGARLDVDASVFKAALYKSNTEYNKTQEQCRKLGITKFGEVVSEPIVPAQMSLWMKKHYPAYADHTCGLHVHMSFEDVRNYQRLMVPIYQNTMLHYLKDWAHEEKLPDKHPLWERLAGENEYCQVDKFWPDKQVRTVHKDYDHHRDGHRYTALSFRWGRWKTIECRVLPMMETVEQGIRGVKRVIEITNASLVWLADRDKDVELSIPYQQADCVTSYDFEEI